MDYRNIEQAGFETTTVPSGLVGARDSSMIESRLNALEKQLSILGEQVGELINRITPIRRVDLTSQSDELRKDVPEEHASEIARKLDQLNRQIQYIQTNITLAISELEI